MWILDSAYRDDGIDLWVKEKSVTRIHYPYDAPFLAHFRDPHANHELIAALEEQYGAAGCTITTIFGKLPGYEVFGDRRVAEMLESQAQYDVELFNVDVRRDQRFMAEKGIFPCGEAGRFAPTGSHNLTVIGIRIQDTPERSGGCSAIEVTHERTEHLSGPERTVLEDLSGLIASLDPDVILMPDADRWMQKIRMLARNNGLVLPFSRNGKYRTLDSRSYWSYGRVEHKVSAMIPDGRILIDTEQSFVYREGGLAGVLMAARLSGLPPSLVSRLTPGTLVSSYETYEAIRQGIAVPFRKSEGEDLRRISMLQAADRGGMMFQPKAGICENVEEIDFTSMYPSIIVQANLSPETIRNPGQSGFLPAVLTPLLDLRIRTKQLKKTDPHLAGIDAVLKWMLVTCFGYTGYKNAKFGRIEVHEGITARSREILLQTKEIAEELDFAILHGIVDCLWVQGVPVDLLKARVERETGLLLEVEHFNWIVFEPLNDGFGAYNRYFGRLTDGSMKVRGIAARRHDTPEYIRSMQGDMLTVMSRATTVAELKDVRDEVHDMYRTAVKQLPGADVQTMVISRRISRVNYSHRCIEKAAVDAYLNHGTAIAPGMKIRYVVTDAGRYQVQPAWYATTFDSRYYLDLLERAWKEIAFAFGPDSACWQMQEQRILA